MEQSKLNYILHHDLNGLSDCGSKIDLYLLVSDLFDKMTQLKN
jgi:hypothetical protein